MASPSATTSNFLACIGFLDSFGCSWPLPASRRGPFQGEENPGTAPQTTMVPAARLQLGTRAVPALCPHLAGSVVVARHECAAFAHQEIQVHAFVGLQHMIDIELPVA